MKQLLILTVFLFSTLTLCAQQRIEGKILDENAAPLSGATIVLLTQADSSMVSFAISNDDGRFRLDDVEAGSFLLQATYVGYGNLEKSVTVNEGEKLIELEALRMELSSEVLQEVTVQAEHIPMGIRGDTISYNAAAFQTRPGANVEELLKKLPGIEVDRDGTIKAQGEEVENVLVDGKEFFGNDQLIATKNLEAEAIDKVEVFDKKSEIAEFTGVDDGQEEKTINLKLKEDYKKGGFGNLTLQGGTEETWKGKLNYNRFNPKMQASVLVSGNNINEQSFSLDEYISFMGGLGNAITNGGGGRLSFGNQFGGRDRAIEGINTDFSIGANLNYDFTDKLQFFSNYFYLSSNGDLWKNIQGSNFSIDGTFENLDTLTTTSTDQNHRLNTKLIYKLNPFNQIVFKNNLQAIIGSRNNQSSTTYFQDELLSSKISSLTNNSKDQFGIESNLQYKRKFQKKGRNWISSLGYKQAELQEKNDVLNDFNSTFENDRLSQFQNYNNFQKEYQLRSDYTEPLGKRVYLGLAYRYQLSQERPVKKFFDRVGEDQFLNELLSSEYQKNFGFHSSGVSLKRNGKKVRLNTAVLWQYSQLEGILNDGELTFSQPFNHILPSFSASYEMKNGQHFGSSYNTSVNAPNLNQLMPIVDNTNPNISITGNPQLIPEYAHNLRLNYNLFDQFNFINFSTYARVSLIKNRIVNQTIINPDFTRSLTPINTDQYLSMEGYVSYYTPIRPLKINARISGNTNSSNYESFINNEKSEVFENNLNWSLRIDNRKKEKIDILGGVRWDYNIRKYAVNSNFDQQFFNFSWFIEGDWHISKSMTFTATYDNTTYSDEFFSERTRYQLLNLSLSQSFAKDRFTLELIAHDLLQQNIGLRRYGTQNGLQESRYNTLGRYFMIGLSYKLSKRAAPESAVKFD